MTAQKQTENICECGFSEWMHEQALKETFAFGTTYLNGKEFMGRPCKKFTPQSHALLEPKVLHIVEHSRGSTLSDKIVCIKHNNRDKTKCDWVYLKKDVREAIQKILEKEFIMQFPKGAINGRGSQFVKVVEVKVIKSEMGRRIVDD